MGARKYPGEATTRDARERAVESRPEPQETNGGPPPWRDPLYAVSHLGQRAVSRAWTFGLCGTLLLHGVAIVKGASIPVEIHDFTKMLQSYLEQRFVTTIDVDLSEPPPPPEPLEPEPEPPEPEPVQEEELPPAPVKEEGPVSEQEDPPPAAASPAQAAAALTAEPSDEPELLDGFELATGNADHYAGGFTARVGKSKGPVMNRQASVDGVPDGRGKGSGPAVKRAPEKDLSRPAMPASRAGGGCPFPPEAMAQNLNNVVVNVVVQVSAQGTPTSVSVLNDPGYGLGAAARRCALRQSYFAGLDRAGKAVPKTTPPIGVRFTIR